MTYPILNIKSSFRLFADDCVLFRNIKTLQDCLILQEDLDILVLRVADWQMQFNLAKCDSMKVTQHIHTTNSSRLHTAAANFGKRSVGNISWHNNHREHGLGSTYL